MDVAVSLKKDRCDGMPKQSFMLKNPRKDGLILQVHHTIPGEQGEIRRVRFIHVAFNDIGEQLAASDHRGNIFIVDLAGCKFWLLVNLGICSVIAFSAVNKMDIIVGSANGTLNIVNTEIGKTTGALKGHSSGVQHLSFAKDRYCLSSSSEEAIIWDLQSNSQVHRLNLRSSVLLKQVYFMPVTNNILACFQDDAIHIWSFETFVCIKQIIPEAWKNHHIRSFAFTRNGRGMVMGGHSPNMIVFDLDDWKVIRVVEMPDGKSGVRHLEFLPGLFDGGANKVLAILSDKCGMLFLDTENYQFLPVSFELTNGIRTFSCSPNGKYMSFVLHTGEINIYMSSRLVEVENLQNNISESAKEKLQSMKGEGVDNHHSILRRQKLAALHLQEIHKEIRETLDLQRLRPILKEFGEYPESYRALIWKTILQLPYNKSAYVSLVNRDCNPAYLHLEEEYPLENRALLKNLKRLLSCLSHWCALFGEVKFLPLFVFPFVKVFQNDPFACFEAVATIIVNWCQHWFEYYPFPPVNILAIIENVLAENDPELMNFFYKVRITSRVYAWPLLEAAFTEVLSVSEWMQLWDHVLSNEPAFLLMAVVSYNISCRSALQQCQNIEDFEHFFHYQNAIDMKRFISKTYSLCRKTTDEIHPRQYLLPFTPLPKDSYPIYNQYPKFILDYQSKQLEQIRKEEDEILIEQERAVKWKMDHENQIKENIRKELQETRLLMLEEAYSKTLKKEEERLAMQRQKISALRRDVRAKELELLEQARTKVMQQQVVKRTAALERLLEDIERKREQDNHYMAEAEDELKSHLVDLYAQKQQLQMQFDQSDMPGPSMNHRILQEQQVILRDQIAKLRDEISSANPIELISINDQISALQNKLHKAESDLAKEMKPVLQRVKDENFARMSKIKASNSSLEREMQLLLQHLAQLRMHSPDSKVHECKKGKSERTHKSAPICSLSLSDNQKRGNVSENENSRYANSDKVKSSSHTKCPLADARAIGDCRSPAYYQSQRRAVKSAMDVREKLLRNYKAKT